MKSSLTKWDFFFFPEKSSAVSINLYRFSFFIHRTIFRLNKTVQQDLDIIIIIILKTLKEFLQKAFDMSDILKFLLKKKKKNKGNFFNFWFYSNLYSKCSSTLFNKNLLIISFTSVDLIIFKEKSRHRDIEFSVRTSL